MFKRIRNRKTSLDGDSQPFKPARLEKLEARILLFGDGLLGAAVPDPFLDTMPQVVQHAESLEPSEHIEQQLTAERETNQLEADLLQPIK